MNDRVRIATGGGIAAAERLQAGIRNQDLRACWIAATELGWWLEGLVRALRENA